jgi:hypothetical protein
MATRGRPPKDEMSRKSEPVSIRLTPRLRARLEEERKNATPERTFSQEIEFRLRRSFEDPEQPVKDRFGGPTPYLFFLIIANQLITLERFTGERWWRDPYTHRQARVLLGTFMDWFKPAGRPRTPSRFIPIGIPLGQHLAEREMANVESTLLDPNPPIGWNWGGMTVTEWRKAAELFKSRMTSNPLKKLYSIGRTKK